MYLLMDRETNTVVMRGETLEEMVTFVYDRVTPNEYGVRSVDNVFRCTTEDGKDRLPHLVAQVTKYVNRLREEGESDTIAWVRVTRYHDSNGLGGIDVHISEDTPADTAYFIMACLRVDYASDERSASIQAPQLVSLRDADEAYEADMEKFIAEQREKGLL